eukprot:249823_1
MAQPNKTRDKNISFCMISCPYDQEQKSNPSISLDVDLHGGTDDCKNLKQLLNHLNGQKSSKYKLNAIESSKSLYDPMVTADHAQNNIRKWLDDNRSADQLVLYYSGHGSKNGMCFYKSALNYSELIKDINKAGLKGEIALIIDACHSGGIANELYKYLSEEGKFETRMTVFYAVPADNNTYDARDGNVFSKLLFDQSKWKDWCEYFLNGVVYDNLMNHDLGKQMVSGYVQAKDIRMEWKPEKGGGIVKYKYSESQKKVVRNK